MESTRWSLVLRAGAGSLGALDDLCGAYWFPVFAYLRRRGHDAEQASDLTQDFFMGLLRRNDLARVRPDGRRFRSWLFTAVHRHHFRHLEHGQAKKRVGEDVADAEAVFQRTAAAGLNPEQAFARQWALAVLRSARDRVAQRYAERGEADAFVALAPCLDGALAPHSDVASQLGCRPGAVKVAVHRLKKRFGEALRVEVAETLDGEDVIDDELRFLLDCLRGSPGAT